MNMLVLCGTLPPDIVIISIKWRNCKYLLLGLSLAQAIIHQNIYDIMILVGSFCPPEEKSSA